MTNDLTLSRRAVACPGWRWLAGMLDQHGRRIIDVNTGRNEGIPVEWADAIACGVVEMYEHPDDARAEWADAVPDLTDPCTLGGLEALVRDRWGDGAHASPDRGRNPNPDWWVWRKIIDGWTVVARGPTRAAALVAALEAP
jgi:hypothetical protein